MLGMSPSGVTSLAARAREGLREAYLTAHAESAGRGEACRYSGQLGAYVRRGGRVNKPLRRHLTRCARCRTAVLELTDLNQRLRGVLPAGVLLWGASAYLTARGAEAAVVAAKAGAESGAYTAAAGTGGAGGPATPGPLASVKTPLVGGAAVTVVAGGLLLGGLLLPGDDGDPAPDPRPGVRAQGAQPEDTPRSPSEERTSSTRRPSPSTSSSRAEPETGGSTSLPPADARTTLRVASTERCMRIARGPGAEGAQPREAACDGGRAQVWGLLLPYGDDRSRIQLRNEATGLCLTNSGTRTDGAPVRQRTCERTEPRQLWQMYGGDGAEVRFADRSGQMYLGLRDWSAGEKGTEHSPVIATSHHYYASPSFGFEIPAPLFAG
ncbi:RICIN domain-containing protein [Streptomyces oceani]|uniref:RICIN domain-containing protein n=1 Tax=Streptomyces oceani TaxID=1075402 RepID=UPI0030B864C0